MNQAGPIPGGNQEREDLIRKYVDTFLEEVASADKPIMLIQIDPDKTPDRLGFGKEIRYMDILKETIVEKKLFPDHCVIVAPAFLSIKILDRVNSQVEIRPKVPVK